jgi:DNA-directed RNA polymerase specialized sigma24 family protein
MTDSAQQMIDGLRLLLARLDRDGLLASEKYYRLISTLTLFIEHRIGISADSEYLARVTLDTVATKLAQGENIQNLQAYSFGVARNVLSAYRRKATHESAKEYLAVAASCEQGSQETITKEVEEACRQKCLRALPEEQRDLIVRYYQNGLQSKQYRDLLARELEITTEALCNRISRIKKKLGECHGLCVRARKDAAIL